MKTSTKILTIISVLFLTASVFLGKFFIEGIVPNGSGFNFNISKLGIVALVIMAIALVLAVFLYAKFIKTQKLSVGIFLSALPITLIYGTFVAYTSSVSQMQGITAQSVRETLKISKTSENYNSILWVVLATLVYLFVLFALVMLLCRPLSRLEKATIKLGDGRTGNENFKFGGGRQFQEIEHAVNKINFNFKDSTGRKFVNFDNKDGASKQFFKLVGKNNLVELEYGNPIKKSCSLLMCKFSQKNDRQNLNLKENFGFVNSYMKIVLPLVKKYDGFVDKYMSDGALFVFEKAQNALECAKLILESADKGKTEKIDVQIALEHSVCLFGMIGEESKTPTIISDENKRLDKMQEINDFMGTKLLLTKDFLNEFQNRIPIDFRYVGAVSCEEDNLCLYECLSCYEKHKKNKLKKMKNRFENAVLCYEKGQYETAKELFGQILHAVSDDNASYVYFNNCADKIKDAV